MLGWERWLDRYEHWLPFQRTLVQVPAPTWQLATISNSSPRGSGVLFWLSRDFSHVVHIHTPKAEHPHT